MKKYLIITRRVSKMGGAQLFVLRRSMHLQHKGYEVHVVVIDHSDYYPLEDGFKGIPVHYVPEIKDRVAQYTKSQQERVIDKLLGEIGVGCDFFVESHILSAIEWGELISSKCGAKHLAYPLAESAVKDYGFQPGKRIFEEKLNKGEFYGCTSTSLRLIFNKKEVPSHYVNIGYDENELIEECKPSIEYKKEIGDFVITTVTRLDKMYIEWLVDASANLARKYPEQNFILLIAGGSPKPERERFLKTNFNNAKYNLVNLNIRYLGYVEKLGKDIFKISDVFVGMGTASINAISQHCPTINIDPRDGMKMSSGFFGRDTKNFAYSENGKIYTILQKLEEAYLMGEEERRELSNDGRNLFEKEFEIKACFRRMDEVVNSINVVSDRASLRIPNYYRCFVKGLFSIKTIMRRETWRIANSVRSKEKNRNK